MKTGLWSNEKKAHLVRWVQIYSFCAIGGRAAPSMHRSYHHIMIWGCFCRSASANWGHLTTWTDRMTRFLCQRIFPRGRCRLWRFKLRLWIQTFTSSLKSFRYAGGETAGRSSPSVHVYVIASMTFFFLALSDIISLQLYSLCVFAELFW